MNDIPNLSIAQLQRAIAIKEQIESLLSELASVVGTAPIPAPAVAPVAAPAVVPVAALVVAPAPPKQKKVMSPAARAKIAAAQKTRWAKVKGLSAAPAKAPAAAAAPKKKRRLSPEGRARIVAAAKARWAKKKNGGK